MFLFACRKENEPITLKIYPQHHGAPIYGATAYIEFNTQTNAGATSNYDLSAKAGSSQSYIRFENFPVGDIFIYCVGYDPHIHMPVLGGIPYTVKSGESGEISVNVPVVE